MGRLPGMNHNAALKPKMRSDRNAKSYVVAGHVMSAKTAAPGLYIVATPIGNLGDVTLRALETLAAVDLVACEDTRVTRKLLDRYSIVTALVPYHDHNAEIARPKILARLAEGAAVALVSDAGTPLVSDPGFKLVRATRAAGHTVTAVPGASAVVASLSIAGLPTDHFFFEGFLPVKQSARRARIAVLGRIPATLVIFETGPRLAAALADLAAQFGPRDSTICRELTKLHEEVRRGDLAGLAQEYSEGGEIRGEFVIVVAPPPVVPQVTQAEDIDRLLRQALAISSLKDAVSAVVEATGQPRRDVYRRALALARVTDDEAQG